MMFCFRWKAGEIEHRLVVLEVTPVIGYKANPRPFFLFQDAFVDFRDVAASEMPPL